MRKITNPATEVCLPGFEKFHPEFLKSRREELISLVAALKELDFSVLIGHSHKWRGFSAPYGFQELAVLAEELETEALRKNSQSCELILVKIADYLGTED